MSATEWPGKKPTPRNRATELSTGSCVWAPPTPSRATSIRPSRRCAGTYDPADRCCSATRSGKRRQTPQALAALDASPNDFPDLAGLIQRVQAASFEPTFGHVSTLAEWDDYQWSWTGALTDWALHEAPTEADRVEALAAAREHRQAWLAVVPTRVVDRWVR